MPEYSGSIPSFELAAALWLTPLVPILAAAYALFAGRALARGPGARTERRPPNPVWVGLGAALLAFGALAFHSVVLALLPLPQRTLVSHAWNLVRIGSLDASFTLTMDPGTALVSLAVAGATSVILAFGAKQKSLGPTEVAGTLLLLAGALWVLLADDWLGLTFGSSLAGLGALVLAASSAVAIKSFLIGRLGDALLLGAGAIVMWGLGGSWTGAGDYVPDFRARLVGVELGEARPPKPGQPLREGSGLLTMATLPGATVTLGGATLCRFDADGKPGGVGTSGRACREPARSPFARIPMGVALHDFEVTSGPGTNDLVVQKVRLSAGHESMITPSGATLVMREMRAATSIRDGNGGYPIRAALSTRRIFGLPLMAIVASLIGLALALRGAIAPLVASLRPAESADSKLTPALVGIELFVAGAILSRVEFLVLSSPRTSAVVAALFAVTALIAALRASHALDARAALGGVAAANLALSGVAFSAGAYVGGVVLLAVSVAAVVAFGLAVLGASKGTDLREESGAKKSNARLARVSALAALALAGAPIPAVGVFLARDAAIGAVARVEALGFLGWVATVAGVLASGFTAFAVWRLHHVVFEGPAKKGTRAGAGGPMAALDALAVSALGVGLLALTPGLFGDAVPALLARWLPTFGDASAGSPLLDRSVRLGLVGASFVAGVVGWSLARSRYRDREKSWAETESARLGHGVLARTPSSWLDPLVVAPATGAASFLVNLDLSLEKIALGTLHVPAERVSLTEVSPAPVPEPEVLEEPKKPSKKKKKKKRGSA